MLTKRQFIKHISNEATSENILATAQEMTELRQNPLVGEKLDTIHMLKRVREATKGTDGLNGDEAEALSITLTIAKEKCGLDTKDISVESLVGTTGIKMIDSTIQQIRSTIY